MDVTEMMAELVLQIGIILFAVRLGGGLARKVGIPSVLGELLAGIIIGPYALGGITLPGFPHGIFPLGENGSIAVSMELYAFATVASIILLFISGLETDLGLFIKYSVAGGLIGLGGAIVSFAVGVGCGFFLLQTLGHESVSIFDPRCLFLGIISTATSVGITARILSDQKKMDSPEGVTILAAAVFDDVLGIIMLAVILGIVALISGGGEGGFHASAVLGIAGKAFGIWLGFTVIGLIFAKQIASFLKLFKHSYVFAVLSLGIALILAGFFERHGLAMIIGAYITGLSLSKTDIAAVIQNRIHGLYEFFVPLFFAVMGMMVNVKEIFSFHVLVFGGIFTVAAVFGKIIGCGGPALALGFNVKGALRIGIGMVPRGEVALIIAGIGMAAGILDDSLFSVAILLTLISTVVSPPMLNFSLKVKGQGTRKPVKDEDSASHSWEFGSPDIARLAADRLVNDLRAENFYVQIIRRYEFAVARKDDISLTIKEEGSKIIIDTLKKDMVFAKNIVFESVISLYDSLQQLKDAFNPEIMKKELLDAEGRKSNNLLSLIETDSIIMDLKGKTKEEVINELVDALNARGKLLDRDLVISDIFEREKVMSTGMEHGIAIPHTKTDGVEHTAVAVGISREGINFDSMDGLPSRIFILEVSPKTAGTHIQFLAAIGSKLKDQSICEALMYASSPMQIAEILKG